MRKTFLLILTFIIIYGMCAGFSAESSIEDKTNQEIINMILSTKKEHEAEFKRISYGSVANHEAEPIDILLPSGQNIGDWFRPATDDSVTVDELIAFAAKYYTGDRLYGFMHNDYLFHIIDGVLYLRNEDQWEDSGSFFEYNDTFDSDGTPLTATGYYRLIRNGNGSFYLIEERNQMDGGGFRYPVTLYKYIDGEFKLAAASAEENVKCGDEYEYEEKDFAAYAIATDVIGRYLSVNAEIPDDTEQYTILDPNVKIEIISYTLDDVKVRLSLPTYDENDSITELKHYNVVIKRENSIWTEIPKNAIYYFTSDSQRSAIESLTLISTEEITDGAAYPSKFLKCSHSEVKYEVHPAPATHNVICMLCGDIIKNEDHAFGEWHQTDEKTLIRTCEKCGYTESEIRTQEPDDTTQDPDEDLPDTPVNPDDPATPYNPQQQEEPTNNIKSWIIIFAAVCVIAIIAIIEISVNKKKK